MSGTMPIAQTITFNSLRMYRDTLESDSKKDICVPRDEMAKFLLLLQDAPVSFETTCLNLKEDDQQIMTQLPRCNEIWRGKILRLELDGNLREQTGNIVPAIKTASIHDYEEQTWGKYAKDCAKSIIGNCSKLDLPVPHIVDWMFTVWTERWLVISTNLTWDKEVIQRLLEAIKERCTPSSEECGEPKTVVLAILNKETTKRMSVAIENKYLQNITIELGSGDKDIAMLLRTCGHIWRDTDLYLALDDILLTLEESDRNAVILAISTARTLTLKSNCSTVYLEKLLNKNCFELELVDDVKSPNVFEKMSNFFNGGQGALSLPVEKIVGWMFMPAPKIRKLTVETDMDLDKQEIKEMVDSMFVVG
ncbi:hypothetical protein Ddc_16353 [Ditylenchus destructor]|nr:hypothetical protein Ddc_16353 [Ditylenchus destructor]